MHGLETIKALNDKCLDSNSETMTVLRIMNAGHLQFDQGVFAPIQELDITHEANIAPAITPGHPSRCDCPVCLNLNKDKAGVQNLTPSLTNRPFTLNIPK